MIQNIIIILLLLIIIDIFYLLLIKDKFSLMINNIQKNCINITDKKIIAIIICYILLACGLWFFVINDNINNKNKNKVILKSFLLGFIIYGIYETTNYAIFNNWDLNIVLIDSLWGGILLSIVTYIYI